MPTTSRQTTLVLTLLSTVVFLAVVNGTMINIALPYVGADFGVSEGTYGWIVTGYALSFGIFNAINGRLADIVGMKRMYMAGIAAFGLGAAVVAASPSIEFAIVLRILQGAGAAALPVLGSSIIARIVPPRERGAAMGVIMSTVGVAASIGPFLGGFLVEIGGWRFVFGFTALVLLALPAAWKLLPDELNERTSSSFDIVGAVLLSVAVAVGMYGFEVVEEGGFGSTLWILEAVALAFTAAFGVWIAKHADPFVAPSLFRNVRYVATTGVAFLVNATRFGTIILVPIFLTEVNELSPIWIGAVLFPGALAIAVLSHRAGGWADRVGTRRPVSVGVFFVVAGNLVAAFFAGGSPVGVAVGMGLYGIGFALIQSPCVSAVSQIVPKPMIGVGLGIFMMIFFIGGAFGTALSVTAVELQGAGATSWLGFDNGDGAAFSNGILVLTGLALLAVVVMPFVPNQPMGADEDKNVVTGERNHLAP